MEVRELRDIADLHRVAALFQVIWETGPAVPVTPELLRALADHGGYVAAAWSADGEMIGASAAFTGLVDGRPELHSHITGVLPAHQGSGAGSALKHHQRGWALERGIDVITWTFDPLVRRNGWFNLEKLGAIITDYREHYYGDMADGVNAGEQSDRCLVEWRLDGARPAPGDDVVRCATPHDVVALRRTDPDAAHAWRVRVREAMAPAFAAGYVGVAMTDAGEYVLTR